MVVVGSRSLNRWPRRLLLMSVGLGFSLEGTRGDGLTGDGISEGCGKAASENMEPICSLKPAAELA